MNKIIEYLPFILPLAIAELGLLIYTIYHILSHQNYKRGNRKVWIIIVIVGMQFIGPILYFLIGREDN
jgi:hypothetical protein